MTRGRHQGTGERVPGASQYFGGSALLDDLAVVHDQDPVGEAGDDSEVMSDDHQRAAGGVLKRAQYVEQAGLVDRVQSGGDLVADQQVRFREECTPERGSLELTAGQRGGQPARAELGDAEPGEFVESPAAGFGAAESAEAFGGAGDLVEYRDELVERGASVLVDVLDAGQLVPRASSQQR